MEIDNAMIMMVADRVKGKSRTFVNDTNLCIVSQECGRSFTFSLY